MLAGAFNHIFWKIFRTFFSEQESIRNFSILLFFAKILILIKCWFELHFFSFSNENNCKVKSTYAKLNRFNANDLAETVKTTRFSEKMLFPRGITFKYLNLNKTLKIFISLWKIGVPSYNIGLHLFNFHFSFPPNDIIFLYSFLRKFDLFANTNNIFIEIGAKIKKLLPFHVHTNVHVTTI